MSESIDDPSSFVETPVPVRAGIVSLLSPLRVLYQWQVLLVDCIKHILTPCNQVTPDAYIIVQVRESFSPCL